MIFSFDLLPNYLWIWIYSEWLTTDELGLLDNVFLNTNLRPIFLSILKETVFFTYGINRPANKTYCQWLIQRQVKVKQLYLNDFTLLQPYYTMNYAPPTLQNPIHAKKQPILQPIQPLFCFLESITLEYFTPATDSYLLDILLNETHHIVELNLIRSSGLAEFMILSNQLTQLTHLNLTEYKHNINTDDLTCFFPFSYQLTYLSLEQCRFDSSYTLNTIFTICDHITTLNLSYIRILSDEHIHNLVQTCSYLISLDITNCMHLTDQAIILIGNAYGKQLQSFHMSNLHQLTSESMLYLANHMYNLLDLNITGYDLTNSLSSFRKLIEHCPMLQYLYLGQCIALDDLTLIRIAECCSDLRVLDINYCYKISDYSLLAILKCCLQLQSLTISYCYKITDFFLIELSKSELISFHALYLHCCNEITDEGILELAMNEMAIQEIDLGGNGNITDIGVLALIAGCQSTLSYLNISDNPNITSNILDKIFIEFGSSLTTSETSLSSLVQSPYASLRLKELHLVNCPLIDPMTIEKYKDRCDIHHTTD